MKEKPLQQFTDEQCLRIGRQVIEQVMARAKHASEGVLSDSDTQELGSQVLERSSYFFGKYMEIKEYLSRVTLLDEGALRQLTNLESQAALEETADHDAAFIEQANADRGPIQFSPLVQEENTEELDDAQIEELNRGR